MCGVFIAYSKNGVQLPKNKCLDSSKDLLNRGPDYLKFDYFRNNTLYIANSVLAITPNQNTNKKIIYSNSKNHYISFNGEIFNFNELKKLISKTCNSLVRNYNDTETLVNLYDLLNDEKIPNLLNGMYAYIIYNKKKDELIIVNDSQGEKNLYYYVDKDFFLISSTIKAILRFVGDQNVNLESLQNYFKTRHFMPINGSCFKKIKIFKNSSNSKYLLNKNLLIQNQYDDPSDWISEKKYLDFNRMHENEVINLLDRELNEQAKIMVPRVKFGCIVSGGIDSSLQAAIISKYKSAELYLAVNHLGKDPIMSNIKKFNLYFPKKIQILEMSPKKYRELTSECYIKVSSPLHTHDLPSRLLLSRYFKEKNCKVFFSADGCDELFGGQQVYEKIFVKKYDFKKNQSPYSSIIDFDLKTNKKDFILDNYLKKKWKKTYKKYEFVESLRDRNILSSLYNDYFIQSINVANRSNDLICCDSSVEPRNIFIQKKILKLIINLPLKYKINFECQNKNIRQKYILKKTTRFRLENY